MFFPIQEVKLHIGSLFPFFGTQRVMLFQNSRPLPTGPAFEPLSAEGQPQRRSRHQKTVDISVLATANLRNFVETGSIRPRRCRRCLGGGYGGAEEAARTANLVCPGIGRNDDRRSAGDSERFSVLAPYDFARSQAEEQDLDAAAWA